MHIDHKIKELGVSGSSFDGMESVVYGLRSRPAPLIRQGTVGHPEHFSWPEVVWKQAKNNKAAWLFFFYQIVPKNISGLKTFAKIGKSGTRTYQSQSSPPNSVIKGKWISHLGISLK